MEVILAGITGLVTNGMLEGRFNFMLKNNVLELAIQMQVLHLKKTRITNPSRLPLIVKNWLDRVDKVQAEANLIVDWQEVHSDAQANPRLTIAEIVRGKQQEDSIVIKHHKNWKAYLILRETMSLIDESVGFIAMAATVDPSVEETNEVNGEETNNVRGEETNNVTGDEVNNVRGEETNNVRGDEVNNVRGEETNNVRGDETNHVRGDETNDMRVEEMNIVSGDEMNNARGGETNNVLVESPNSEVYHMEVNRGVPEIARQNLQAQGVSVGGVANNFGHVNVINNVYYGESSRPRRAKRQRTSIIPQ